MRQRSDSDVSGLNNSKVSYNSMGTSFSDRILRMKPIEKKNKIGASNQDNNPQSEGKGNKSDSSLLSDDSGDDSHRPLTLSDLVSIFMP